jgi:hypothetical protein
MRDVGTQNAVDKVLVTGLRQEEDDYERQLQNTGDRTKRRYEKQVCALRVAQKVSTKMCPRKEEQADR